MSRLTLPETWDDYFFWRNSKFFAIHYALAKLIDWLGVKVIGSQIIVSAASSIFSERFLCSVRVFAPHLFLRSSSVFDGNAKKPVALFPPNPFELTNPIGIDEGSILISSKGKWR